MNLLRYVLVRKYRKFYEYIALPALTAALIVNYFVVETSSLAITIGAIVVLFVNAIVWRRTEKTLSDNESRDKSIDDIKKLENTLSLSVTPNVHNGRIRITWTKDPPAAPHTVIGYRLPFGSSVPLSPIERGHQGSVRIVASPAPTGQWEDSGELNKMHVFSFFLEHTFADVPRGAVVSRCQHKPLSVFVPDDVADVRRGKQRDAIAAEHRDIKERLKTQEEKIAERFARERAKDEMVKQERERLETELNNRLAKERARTDLSEEERERRINAIILEIDGRANRLER